MNLNREGTLGTVNRLSGIAKDDFILEVKRLYVEYAKYEFQYYKSFTDDVLNKLFLKSTFFDLVNKDLYYVLSKGVNHWANHIVQEIQSKVDFKDLREQERKGY